MPEQMTLFAIDPNIEDLGLDDIEDDETVLQCRRCSLEYASVECFRFHGNELCDRRRVQK